MRTVAKSSKEGVICVPCVFELFDYDAYVLPRRDESEYEITVNVYWHISAGFAEVVEHEDLVLFDVEFSVVAEMYVVHAEHAETVRCCFGVVLVYGVCFGEVFWLGVEAQLVFEAGYEGAEFGGFDCFEETGF